MAIDAAKLSEAYAQTRAFALCLRHVGDILENSSDSERQRLALEFNNKINSLAATMREGLGQD